MIPWDWSWLLRRFCLERCGGFVVVDECICNENVDATALSCYLNAPRSMIDIS